MADSTNTPSPSSGASQAQSTPPSTIRPSSFAPSVPSPLSNVQTHNYDTETNDTETDDTETNETQIDDAETHDAQTDGAQTDDTQTDDTRIDEKQVTPKVPSFRDLTMSTEITYVKLSSEQTFTVHTDLLRYWSPELCDILNDDAKELSLVGDVKVAGIFLDWLYTGRLNTLDIETYQYDPAMEDQSKRPGLVREDGELEHPGWYYRTSLGSVALDLYVFATLCNIRQLRNQIIFEMHKLYKPRRIPLYSIVYRAYEQLPPESLLLLYLVDIYSARYRDGMDDAAEAVWRRKVPDAFFVTLLEGPDIKTINVCDYHEHLDDEEKKNCPANIEEIAAPEIENEKGNYPANIEEVAVPEIENEKENCPPDKEEDAGGKTENDRRVLVPGDEVVVRFGAVHQDV